MLAPIKAMLIVFKGLSDGHFSCLAFLALRLQTFVRFRSYIKQYLLLRSSEGPQNPIWYTSKYSILQHRTNYPL